MTLLYYHHHGVVCCFIGVGWHIDGLRQLPPYSNNLYIHLYWSRVPLSLCVCLYVLKKKQL